MEQFVAEAGSYINTNPWLAIVAVFLGGLLTAASPCVLAMIPLMMGYVAGQDRENQGFLRALSFTLVFIGGLTATFVGLGMLAALAGQLYGDISFVWNWVVCVVCLIMGLHLLGAFNVPIPAIIRFQPRTQGLLGALILGLLFGFVSAPCAAPILVVLLTYLAGSGGSVAYGGFLLLMYGLGHSALILVAGTSVGIAQRLLASQQVSRVADIMKRLAGVVIVLVGLYFGWKGL
jgi:cytochrome c-type biogenesis protein